MMNERAMLKRISDLVKLGIDFNYDAKHYIITISSKSVSLHQIWGGIEEGMLVLIDNDCSQRVEREDW